MKRVPLSSRGVINSRGWQHAMHVEREIGDCKSRTWVVLLTADCRYYDAVMMRNEYAILQAKHNGA
jgi:hypothetical protein